MNYFLFVTTRRLFNLISYKISINLASTKKMNVSVKQILPYYGTSEEST